MNRARELRHSGSDIVVEEDLANVFGRCRISPALASSFKTVITTSSSNVSLLEGIRLQGGPGPTVVRAFQESPYFAMVAQLSLLVWTFHTNYLATALTDSLRKRSEGAPPSSVVQISPDREGILGVLNACESQTSAFNWNMILNTVSTTLGYQPKRNPMDFPQFTLQGLLDMIPMAQTLPNDRLIHIQIPVGKGIESGVSALVVWAHHVLDLTVLVRPRKSNGTSSNDVRFGGSGVEQVFIEEVDGEDEAIIILLDSQKEHLLTIKPEPDADFDLIGAVRRTPARGWGNIVLADNLEGFVAFPTRPQAVLEDLQTVTSAFALIICKHLIKDDSDRDSGAKPNGRGVMTYDVNENRLLRASRFLLDNPRINLKEVNSFVALYSFKALDERLPLPSALDAASRMEPVPQNRERKVEEEWNQICGQARRLSIFLIALAHVVHLEECDDLIFAGLAIGDMFQHPLAQQLEEWNGQDALLVRNDAWLQAVAVPLVGHQRSIWKLPWDRVCLFSDRGWSAYITTFGDSDPSLTNVGSMYIGRGSPCRDGVWKTGIWDLLDRSYNFATEPQRAESCGQKAYLRCTEKITLDSPYCGEGEDVFCVIARFRINRTVAKQRPFKLVGYKELQKCLWWAQLSKSCSHGDRKSEEVKLAMGCATVSGFGHHLDAEERILIWLTAHSKGARWLALTTIPWVSVWADEELFSRQILLRKSDCCFQCVIDQAAGESGKWFIVL